LRAETEAGGARGEGAVDAVGDTAKLGLVGLDAAARRGGGEGALILTHLLCHHPSITLETINIKGILRGPPWVVPHPILRTMCVHQQVFTHFFCR
jgi:hypothetical protein